MPRPKATASAAAASTRSCNGVLRPSSREGREGGGDDEEEEADDVVASFDEEKPFAPGGGRGKPAATCFVRASARLKTKEKRKKKLLEREE